MSTLKFPPAPTVPRPLPALTLLALAAGLWFAAAVNAAPEHGFAVEFADTRVVDSRLILDARIRYQFSPEVEEALYKGIAVFVILDIEIVRPRKWRWDLTVAEFEHHYRIERHALSGQFMFTHLASGERRRFESLDEMLSRLGEVSGLGLVDVQQLEADTGYQGRLRARLDIEALPSPLRPTAYLSGDWRLASPWHTWRIAP